MGASQSTPAEKIAYCCRSGNHEGLQRQLADLQRNDSAYQSNRAHYLEATDEQGNTPLTLAAARGHRQCVQVLLGAGANVHHMNRKADGGTALHEAVAHKHEAVVELLLRHRANPFVENCEGHTAMDIACRTRNVPLLRRLEQCAPYAGWLLVKVPQFAGLGSAWQRRWVVVCHRFPSPTAATQLTHCVFLAYKKLDSSRPASCLWLDGAKARPVFNPKAEARMQIWSGGAPRVPQAEIALHRAHKRPEELYTTGGHIGAGGQQESCTFYLRPDDGSQQSSAALDKLIRTVNNRGFPPDGAAAPAAAASPFSAPTSPHTPTYGRADGAAARPHLPPAQAGPLYSHLPGVGATNMANAPGTWGAHPPLDAGNSSGSMAAGTESDEAIARRLQEEYDAEVARQMSQGQGPVAAGPAPSAPQAPPSAPAVPAAPAARPPDYLTGAAFYPRVHHAEPEPLQPAAAGSGSYPGSTPGTPGPGAAGPQPLGRPSAPALLDLDYPLPELPLAVGVAALGGGGGGGGTAPRPTHLPISVSGRHVSAPRLQDDARLADAPAAPPSRASSEPGPAAASSAAAGGAAQPPASPSDDSTVCVFCMDAPATAGVLHGESVHKCLCRDCAVHLKESNVQTCPMCREPVQAFIMRVF